MRCPLCDGPVVNGRCKECGMPYRNDEILYHLNESRDDHYRHASDKARKIMQAQQKAGTGTAAKSRTQKKKEKPEKAKKRSKFVIIWAILILLGVISPLIGDIGDAIKAYQDGKTTYNADTDAEEDTYFNSWDDDEGYKYYMIAAGFGTAQAGVQINPGKYGIYTVGDEVTLVVNRDTGDEENYTLKYGDDTLFLTFEEGDSILVESEESDYDSIYLMEWEN